MSKQDELDKLKKLQSHNEKSREGMAESWDRRELEIMDLKKQIADAEVTYSIGDRFKDEEGEKCILGSSGADEVIMIGLKRGYRYSEPISISSYYQIPQVEFSKKFIDCKFTRYWDNRKQEKC